MITLLMSLLSLELTPIVSSVPLFSSVLFNHWGVSDTVCDSATHTFTSKIIVVAHSSVDTGCQEGLLTLALLVSRWSAFL